MTQFHVWYTNPRTHSLTRLCVCGVRTRSGAAGRPGAMLRRRPAVVRRRRRPLFRLPVERARRGGGRPRRLCRRRRPVLHSSAPGQTVRVRQADGPASEYLPIARQPTRQRTGAGLSRPSTEYYYMVIHNYGNPWFLLYSL